MQDVQMHGGSENEESGSDSEDSGDGAAGVRASLKAPRKRSQDRQASRRIAKPGPTKALAGSPSQSQDRQARPHESARRIAKQWLFLMCSLT